MSISSAVLAATADFPSAGIFFIIFIVDEILHKFQNSIFQAFWFCEVHFSVDSVRNFAVFEDKFVPSFLQSRFWQSKEFRRSSAIMVHFWQFDVFVLLVY